MQCGVIVDKNNCNSGTPGVNAGTVYTAAGYFILSSLAFISDMNVNFYDALANTQGNVLPNVGTFSETFAPIDHGPDVLHILLDVLAIGSVVSLAPVWNVALKAAPFWKGRTDQLGQLKDTVNSLITQGVTITKDSTPEGQAITATNTLDDNMNAIVMAWQKTIDIINSKLFNGSDASIETLHNMITDGKILAATWAVSDQQAQEPIAKTLYGYMIPKAWSLSNKGIRPFILDAGPCDGDPQVKKGHIPKKGAWSMCLKSTNRLYYLLSASGDGGARTCAYGTSCHDNAYSTNIPGLEELDGKAWGGVTPEDFLISAVTAKTRSGGNSHVLDPATALSNNDDDNLLLNGEGVQVPGFVKLPVCSDAEAFKNWLDHGQKHPDTFPCDK